MTQMNEESLEKYIRQFAQEHPNELYLILDAAAKVFYEYGEEIVADRLMVSSEFLQEK